MSNEIVPDSANIGIANGVSDISDLVETLIFHNLGIYF